MFVAPSQEGVQPLLTYYIVTQHLGIIHGY